MATMTMETIERDALALSVARAIALANESALANGITPADSLVTISEKNTPEGRCWQVHYGARDYINRRGGDLIIFVDIPPTSVQRVLYCQ
jgi:hypothetical protein